MIDRGSRRCIGCGFMLGMLSIVASPAAAQLTVTVTSATKSAGGAPVTYTVTGTAAGYLGDNYTITHDTKDAFGVVIAGLRKTTTFSAAGWTSTVTGVAGGVNYCVCISEAPGRAGGEECAPSAPYTTVVPAVSEWGMIVMVLLALTAGTVVFARWRRPAAA